MWLAVREDLEQIQAEVEKPGTVFIPIKIVVINVKFYFYKIQKLAKTSLVLKVKCSQIKEQKWKRIEVNQGDQ